LQLHSRDFLLAHYCTLISIPLSSFSLSQISACPTNLTCFLIKRDFIALELSPLD
jgi:hypothetical protein